MRNPIMLLCTLLSATACTADAVTTPFDIRSANQVLSEPLEVTVKDLGIPPGQNGVVWATNNERGQVALRTTGNPARAFLWSERDGFIALGTLGGPGSATNEGSGAVNDRGQVVGAAQRPSGIAAAFLWDERAGMVELLPGLPTASEARAINDAGAIVGNKSGWPFHWSSRTGLTEISDLPGASNGIGWGINNSGQVVGAMRVATPSGTAIHLFQWTERTGTMDLGQINRGPGIGGPFVNNNRGEIAGGRLHEDNTFTAFVWNPQTGMTDLLPVGAYHSRATHINDRGEVVGIYWTPDAPNRNRSFYWSRTRGFVNLPGLGGPTRVTSINNAGQIVGHSINSADGRQHFVMWQIGR